MRAEVTYNAGRSYRIKSHVFKQGKTVVVKDSAVILKCEATAGFSVRRLKDTAKSKAPEAERVKRVGSRGRDDRKAAPTLKKVAKPKTVDKKKSSE